MALTLSVLSIYYQYKANQHDERQQAYQQCVAEARNHALFEQYVTPTPEQQCHNLHP